MHTTSTTDTPPFLRWAGSKRQLLSELTKHWPNDATRYIEPFVGSACLFFRLRPKKAILSDSNEELIRTYAEVRDNLDSLLPILNEMRPSKVAYLTLRKIQPEALQQPYRAARFIYLNRFCFNGLYRTNSLGQFNVPYGGKKAGQLPTNTHLSNCSQALEAADLRTSDFEEVLEEATKGDFVYLDPPYSVSAIRTFKQYSPFAFSDRDLARLRRSLVKLNRRGVRFLVSYASSDEARLLSSGFRTETLQVRRNISGFSANRRIAQEVLIYP